MTENKIVAVDLGGTNLRVALVKNGKILKLVKNKTPKTKQALLNVMVDSISQVMDKNVKGIGVGSPGPLKDGIIKNTPNLPLKNFNLQAFLKKKFKKKVVIQNDATCVALSEVHYGAKKKNFFILTLGTGIGGGVIIDGKIYTGNGMAGELGHIIIHNGKDLENYWQNYRKQCKKCFGKPLRIKELLKMKDPRAMRILREVTVYLGQGIASLVDVFDPDVVVLMGGAREAGKTFLDMIKKEYRKYGIIPRNVPIVWSKIKHPGILGASLLVK